MSKTWLVTPAFCKWEMLHDCLQWIYQQPLPPGVEHVIIDQHYPINGAYNRAAIKMLAQNYKCTLVDSGEDLGLHRGLNNAVKALGIKPEDILVGCDPDDRPSPGFIEAIESVMRADPTLAILGLTFWVIPWKREKGIPFTDEVIAGHNVWIHPTVEMWNACGWNMKFIHSIGGFDQPNAFYGGLEAKLYPRWSEQGLRLGYLPDVRSDAATVNREDKHILDPEYRQWKDAHLAGFERSFEEWLKIHAPGRL